MIEKTLTFDKGCKSLSYRLNSVKITTNLKLRKKSGFKQNELNGLIICMSTSSQPKDLPLLNQLCL